MFWSIGFLFRCLDAVFGMAMAALAFVAVTGFFVIGGAPKKYEIDALGGAYVNALVAVEDAAEQLRRDYCGRADGEAQLEAACPRPT